MDNNFPSDRGSRKPNFPPSRHDWEAYRERFTQLYYVEERPLKEKTRITEWHLEKNYKTHEKQALLDLFEKVEPSAMGELGFEIRGRPVKMDRVFRYSRERGIARADATKVATLYSVLRPKRRKIQVSRQTNERPAIGEIIRSLLPPVRLVSSLSAPQDLEDFETLMYDTAQYYRSYFSPKERFGKVELLRWQPFFGRSLLSEMIDQYLCACMAARNLHYRSARIYLERAHRQLHLALIAQHSRLLGTIFEILETLAWNPNFETAEIFGRFTADMSGIIHGENHPITRSLQRFCRSGARKDWFLNAFDQMTMTTAKEILGDTHCETIALKIAHCYRLRARDNDEREVVLEEALKTAEHNYGPCHDVTLRALLDRAELYLHGMNDIDMVGSCFEEVRRRCQESSADTGRTCARLKALKGLMCVARGRRSFVETESLCREALDISVKELGHNHYYTKGIAESLVDFLWQERRHDEARECARVYRLDIEAEL